MKKSPEAEDPISDVDSALSKKNMTIPELARCLESGESNPELIGEKKLLQCIAFWKSNCYTDKMIGDFIGKSERHVRRLTKEIKEQNSLDITEGFQKDLLGQMLHQWQNQYSYFIRLANKDEASPLDRMRALYYTHQIQKDVVETLGKYGYLSKEQGLADIEREISKREEGLEDIYILPDRLLEGVPKKDLLDYHSRVLNFIMDEAKKLKEKFKQQDTEK